MKKTDQSGRHDAGVVILYVAIFLLVSLWFVSLAIDVGKVMAARTELQAAADAAALAGASAIDPTTGEVVQDSARVRAADVALHNKAYEGIETSVAIDPEVDVDFPAPNQVRVQVHRTGATGNPVILHFAQTLGVPNVNVIANATAEAKQLTAVCEHLAPFAPQVPPSGDFSTDCDSIVVLKLGSGGPVADAGTKAPTVILAGFFGGRPLFHAAPSPNANGNAGGNGNGNGNGGTGGNAGGNGNGNGNGGTGSNAGGNGNGNGNGNGGTGTSTGTGGGNGGGGTGGGGTGGGGGGTGGSGGGGNFQLLDFPDCNEDDFTGGGANAVEEYTRNGYQCCIGIGDELVLTQPGNKVGPFGRALQGRWDADTDQGSHCYQDYTGNGQRVFLTPIVESFDVNGAKYVRIVKFGAFFLRERPSNNIVQDGVTGQFIKYIAPGNFGSGPPVDTGVYGVHLVE